MNRHDQLQIDQAAAGAVSGTLAEWPHLNLALQGQGYKLPPETISSTLINICRDIIFKQKLDFHLIRQKDKIRTLISRNNYKQAIALLRYSEPLWDHCDYQYKFAELMLLIDDKKRENG